MLSDRDYMRPGNHWRPWDRTQASVIKPLIWANVIFFVLTSSSVATMMSGETVAVSPFFELLHLHPYYIRSAQIWRLGTYMFLHGSVMHILANMWGLFLFGKVVESRLGPTKFLQLYFISGLVGGLAWLLANWNGAGLYILSDGIHTERVIGAPGAVAEAVRKGAEVVGTGGGVVGASGAVFGVMMAAAMTAPDLRIILLFPPIPMRLRTMVAVYAGFEILLTWNSVSGGTPSRIAHLAHLGGLVGAFIYMRRLGYRSPWALMRRAVSNWQFRRQAKHFKRVSDAPTSDFGATSSEIDRILDKIGRTGMGSLSEDERNTLERAGKRFRKG